MKKILILGFLCLGSLMSAMEVPDFIQVLPTEEISSKSMLSLGVEYFEITPMTTEATQELAFQSDATNEVAIREYVAPVALADVGWFYKPIDYEAQTNPGKIFLYDHIAYCDMRYRPGFLPQKER